MNYTLDQLMRRKRLHFRLQWSYLCCECVRCLEVSLWFLWDFLHHVPELSCLPNKMNIGESLKKFCFTKFSKIV